MQSPVYTCSLDNVTQLINRIAEKMPVYGDFGSSKTTLSPKGFFLPALEKLYETAKINDSYKITPAPPENAPFVLLGIRACDAAAIEILDGVYLNDPIDPQYKARRHASYIVTFACETMGANCFCQSVNINPAAPKGDVKAWVKNGTFFWLAQSEKGERLTELLLDLLERTIPAGNDLLPVEPPDSAPALPLPADMLSAFNAPVWDNLHRACIACGTCTFLCPTCQCYDISSHECTENSEKTHCTRQWDACLYPGFTQMAHGNPRPSKKERFRQRFMHKLVYHMQKYGTSACVGCGRCVNKCPVNMNIVKVAHVLAQEEVNAYV
ncbi:MAG: 4Fe-4S dicluster domain-containing protein [Defluviitaleaceae bacterium]|nr:4Fe-4S dicluster domain-containing protein [Defluviitaleaceae bacterium]MCL2275098.1 4Fe-4S dicluster domain-containing protein [Defluviitaleaceae bacterium]